MSTCHDHNYTTEKRAAWNIVNVYKIKHSQQRPFEHRVTDKQNVPVSTTMDSVNHVVHLVLRETAWVLIFTAVKSASKDAELG